MNHAFLKLLDLARREMETAVGFKREAIKEAIRIGVSIIHKAIEQRPEDFHQQLSRFITLLGEGGLFDELITKD